MITFASLFVFAVVSFAVYRDFLTVGRMVYARNFDIKELSYGLILLKYLPNSRKRKDMWIPSIFTYAYILLGYVLVNQFNVETSAMVAFAYLPGITALTRNWAWSLFKAKKAVDAVAASTSVETETIRKD